MADEGSQRPRMMRRLMVAIARAIALLILVAGLAAALTIALPTVDPVRRYIAALIVGVAIFESLRPRKGPVPVQTAPPIPADIVEAQRSIDDLRSEHESKVAALTKAHASEIEKHEAESENVQRAAARALEEIQRSRAASDELRGKVASSQQELDAAKSAHRDTQKELDAAKSAHRDTQKELDAAKSAHRDTQKELDLTRKSSQQLVHGNDALTRQLDEERQRFQAELQRVIAESKSERDEMQAEARAVANRLEELLAQLEREQRLSRETAAARSRVAEENTSLKSQLENLEKQWSAKLQKIASELAADHENDLGDAIAAREEARAETRSLRHEIQSEREKAAARLKQLDDEWSAKLQKIVTELAADHENDIGEAIANREEARAEVRSLNLRLQDLQRQLDSARDGRLGLLQRDDELTQRIARLEEENATLKSKAEEPFPGVNESALREKIEAEWSEKLQTIVTHIASDHEADIGKSIEEREAARAEVRNLNIKMSALQQKLDAERQARESLQTRFREAEEQLRNAPTQPMNALQESFAIEPPAPQEEQRARAEVLEFAEQAQEALRRITSPGDVPLPANDKKPRILFVHHDPALRTLWRDNLDKSGFEVRTASDGLEGLRLAKAERPDIVIADASMPKMDGRELCHLIKSNEETADVKVILLTGIYTNEVPIAAETNKLEADELLRKPVKLEAMKTALSSLLAARSVGAGS